MKRSPPTANLASAPPDVASCLDLLSAALRARGATLATAESCTGGLLAAACTERAGSSAWFERGWVSYSNQSKTEMLGVPATLIEAHGAVSEAVARAMAEGALAHSDANLSVAVTGIAGPSGGSACKPVGTVWFAWAGRGQATRALCRQLPGDRAAVRQAAVLQALQGACHLGREPTGFSADGDPARA